MKNAWVAASGFGKAACVEPRGGKVLWEAAVGKNDYTVAVGADSLVCNGDDAGRVACYRIDLRGATRAWALPKTYGYTGMTPPLIYRGHVYARCKGGKLVCVEIETGKVAAAIDFPGGGGFLIAADGRVLLERDDSHEADEIFMFNADPRDFLQMGAVWPAPNATAYMCPMTPAYADGRLYLRGQDRLLCYELRKVHAHAEPQPNAGLRPRAASPAKHAGQLPPMER